MIKNLIFDEEKHAYYIDGKKKASVSDILKIYDAIHYSSINSRYMLEAADRGTRVHEFTELYDTDADFDLQEYRDENQDIDGYLLAYLRFVQDYGNHFYAVEEPFFSDYGDGYCCTVDRIRLLKDEDGVERETIVDFKTSSKLTNLRNQLQLSLYGAAVYGWDGYNNGDKRYAIVHLMGDGQYELVRVKPLPQAVLENFYNWYWYIKHDKEIAGENRN